MSGTGAGVLFDGARGPLTVGRSVTSTLPSLIGVRSGTGWFTCNVTAVGCELCPISEAVPGAKAAATTFKGSTVNRVGVRRTTRTLSCLVSVKGGVATILPTSGSVRADYLDIGQLVDGSGQPTGLFVSWQSPGAAWSRTVLSTGAARPFGTAGVPTDLVTVGDLDYAVGLSAGVVVDLGATTQTPGVAANVRSFQPPVSGSTVVYCVLQHLGALVYVNGGAGYMSTDAAQTWKQVAVVGSPQASGQSTGGSGYSVGTPLFQY